MDVQTLLNNLHEEVSCSVCMCKYTDPKQLPCLHSFCLHCLNGIQRTSGRRDKIACPECRREFKVPDNGNLSALPTNFRINSLLDVLAIKECNTTGVKCGNCDNRSKESHYCFQCCAFWCGECITFHNGIKANKDHYALALENFQDHDFENILKRPTFCAIPGHEKKEIEFFCNICEVAICNACALTNHDGHGKILLEQAANERKLRVKSAIESQKKSAQTKRSKITKLDESLSEVQEQAARVKRNVQEFADSIITTIEAKKQEIFDDVERRTKASLQEIGKQKEEFEEQARRHESEIENTETLLKRSTSAQLMQPNELMDKILKEEKNKEEGGDRDYCPFQKFDFVKNHKLFDLVSPEQIGSLEARAEQSSADGKGISEAIVGLEAQLAVTTRNKKCQQCYDNNDCVTLEVRNRQGDNCAAEVQVQDNKDGTHKIKYFAKETGTCSASVKVNGEHIRGSPFEVQVKPRQFRPVLSFGEQILKKPWGVAVNEQDEIAVSDVGNHKVHLFKSDGTHIKSFGGQGDQHGEFEWPCGIVFHGANIIVAEQSVNSRVQELSRQGGYLCHFGGKGSLDHQLNFPAGLSIDNDGNIIVADKGNKLIKIFSTDGQFLNKPGIEGSFTNEPFYCIQHDNYLVVSDRGDNSIKCIDRKGNFLYKFGKKGIADGEFNKPDGLSMDRAGHLMVCDSLNHRIQVFDLSGKFVAKFGTKGSGMGEFNEPVSVAVLSDGKIVVTDLRNSRIQIFE